MKFIIFPFDIILFTHKAFNLLLLGRRYIHNKDVFFMTFDISQIIL